MNILRRNVEQTHLLERGFESEMRMETSDVRRSQFEASSDVGSGAVSGDLLSCRFGTVAVRRQEQVGFPRSPVIYCSASPCINLERLLRYTGRAAPQLRASNGIVFLFIVRIGPHYRSLEIALYLPKRGAESTAILLFLLIYLLMCCFIYLCRFVCEFSTL